MDYSAYMRTEDGVWVGTHRLPLSSAIEACKQYRAHSLDCPVALTPDGTDPWKMFILVDRGFRDVPVGGLA